MKLPMETQRRAEGPWIPMAAEIIFAYAHRYPKIRNLRRYFYGRYDKGLVRCTSAVKPKKESFGDYIDSVILQLPDQLMPLAIRERERGEELAAHSPTV